MTKVGDRVPKPPLTKRPRVLSAAAVENELPYTGCLACDAKLDENRGIKHRPGCLYLAYTRALDDVHRLEFKLNLMNNVLKDARDVVNSPEARGLIRKSRP